MAVVDTTENHCFVLLDTDMLESYETCTTIVVQSTALNESNLKNIAQENASETR